MTYYIGIDPGIMGGFAELADNILVAPTPHIGRSYDEQTMAHWLQSFKKFATTRNSTVVATIEAAQAFPKQGRTSCFNYGVGVGLWRGMLIANGIGYTLVRPRAWQKMMLAGLDKSDTKAASVLAASRLFPNVNLRRNEKCRKPDHGMSDALLIAEHCRRMHCGESNG